MTPIGWSRRFTTRFARNRTYGPFQFVIAGYPLSEADLAFVQQRMKEAANEAENARKHAARLQNDADVLRNELEELKQSNAALTAQVKALLPELSEFRYRQMLQGIRELLPA
jgi:predicted RNase H-like nuclease (RuvC/YqgF family)